MCEASPKLGVPVLGFILGSPIYPPIYGNYHVYGEEGVVNGDPKP